jgi:lysine-N-methylase
MGNSEAAKPSVSPPTYAAVFRCIGADCEDTCCGEWDIPVDRRTYEEYRKFPLGKLGSVVSEFVSICSPAQPDELYAQIRRGPSGQCPFFGADHLCGIQREYGPELLSATCSIYPRSLSRIGGELEGSLSLSCPEAARNVLLSPEFMQVKGDLLAGGFRTDNVFHLASDRNKPERFYLAIRTLLIELVRDRSRPLWHRLLLVGSLCRRMADAAPERGGENFLEILSEYRRMVRNGAVGDELEEMPSQPRLKFEVVFELTEARVGDGAGRRFEDVFWAFVECIGTANDSLPGNSLPGNSAPGNDIDLFLQAEERYHRPFFERFPFILENYLVNYMFQNLFPYGRGGSADFSSRGIFEEYLQMTTQFAWINALLVGVAGRYKSDFAGEHVVATIQSLTREVEHYPGVLESIQECIRSRRLDSLQGMAIMLKS